MHRFLRTVGFSKYQKKHKIEGLLRELVELAEPSDIRKIQIDDETNICEVRAEMAPNMGVAVYGEMDENGQINPEYYVPYLFSGDLSSRADCSVQRHTERETFAGLLDEYRVGISLIFYLNNAMEYREKRMSGEPMKISYVNLSALCASGTILLPIQKTAKQMEMSRVASKERNSLLEAARNGDEDAIETLTIEDIDLYSQVSRRVKKEDIYSIIDSCFMPCGIECDQYSVIGDIIHMELLKNRLTGEEVCDLTLNCNDIIFHVAVNRLDLTGEPQVGRRFKGQIWMQGTVGFMDQGKA